MRSLKIVLTACGCPGSTALIRMLKNNGERNIEIIGTDIDADASGRYFCDKFYQVPSGDSKDYADTLLDIVEKETPDVLIPESSYEVQAIARNLRKFEELDTVAMVSKASAIEISNNKYLTYQALKDRSDVRLPRFELVNSFDALANALKILGYPGKKVIFKPLISSGSRGMRIIDANVNRRDILLTQKPQSLYISLEEVEEILSDAFPPLLVSEYLEGGEHTVDCISDSGETLFATVKTREKIRCGLAFRFTLLRKPELVNQAKAIIEELGLSYCSNIQFKGGVLTEINPRVSTFICQKDLNQPYLAIKYALGELSKDELFKYHDKIDYGRHLVRYWDQTYGEIHEL